MNDLKKKIICLLFASIFLCGLIVSAYQVFTHLSQYNQAQSFYSELDDYAVLPQTQEETTSPSLPKVEQTLPAKENVDLPIIDFEALQKMNPDIVGWIYFEGIDINYPVVKHTDNDYYLDHMFNGEVNSSGSIFLDANNDSDFSDKNSILYGHHMKNGTMFSKITNYTEQSYYDEHKVAYLLTADKNYKVSLFSGYSTGASDTAWKISFTNDDFLSWINQVIQKSYFASEVSPKADDRIITFSTCSYEFNNARFVLHGILSEI